MNKSEALTWTFFITQFEDRYVGEVHKEEMRRKFLILKQAAKTVT